MRERERRRCRCDFRQRRQRGSRRADIDAVVEVQLPHDFHERRNRLRISLLQRNVGAAQRLGQPRDLEAGIVFGRVEPPLRQGLADSASDRPPTDSSWCGFGQVDGGDLVGGQEDAIASVAAHGPYGDAFAPDAFSRLIPGRLPWRPHAICFTRPRAWTSDFFVFALRSRRTPKLKEAETNRAPQTPVVDVVAGQVQGGGRSAPQFGRLASTEASRFRVTVR
jgi:hypothetical protein